MATLNLSSLQALSFHCLSSSFPQNTPTLSFNFQPKPSANPRPISLKPYVSEKPRARVVALAVKSLGETEAVAVSPEDGESAGELPSGSGVYAVYDTNGDVQFIGLSRNIAASVAAHWKSVPELYGSVKMIKRLRKCLQMPHGSMIGSILTRKSAMLHMENGCLTVH